MSTNIPGTTNAYPALRTNEFFTISIQHIPTGEMVEFEGWVTTFSDNYTSQWNETQVYGRMDPLSTFQGTRRSISLGFDVVNDSLEHGQENLQKIAKFMKFLYPVYSNKTPSIQNVLQGAPLLSIKWTNLISNANGDRLVGYINGGLSYQPDMGEGGFMTPSIPEKVHLNVEQLGLGIRNYIPKKVSLNFSFTVLHTHLVGWAPDSNAASNTSFTFAGKKEIQNNFPFVHSTPSPPAALPGEPANVGTVVDDTRSPEQRAIDDGIASLPELTAAQREEETRALARAADNQADASSMTGRVQFGATPPLTQDQIERSYSGPPGVQSKD